MGKQSSVDDRMSKLNALSEAQYKKEELLPEYFALQAQMVDMVFGDVPNKDVLKIYDVFKEVERRNHNTNEIATEEIKRFSKSSREFSNLIKAELSGRKGENLVARELYKLQMPNKILKNVEIDVEGVRTEIDALVIGKNGISIVEVKNSMRDVFINEGGHLYRVGEHISFDSNLLKKMNARKEMIKKVLQSNGIAAPRIENIVVFTNEKVNIQNKCDDLRVCFIGQLRRVIESNRTMFYSQGQFEIIAETILENQYQGLYEVNMNVESFKNDLINVLNKLECKKEKNIANVVKQVRENVVGTTVAVLNRIWGNRDVA